MATRSWMRLAVAAAAACGLAACEGDGGGGGGADADAATGDATPDTAPPGDGDVAGDPEPDLPDVTGPCAPTVDGAGLRTVPCCVVDEAPRPPVEAALGGWTVRVEPWTGAWQVLSPAGAPAFEGPGACAGGPALPAAVAATGEPEAEGLFGAYAIDLDALPWQEVRPAGPRAVEAGPDALVIRYEAGADGALAVDLRFEAEAGGGLRVALAAGPDTALVAGDLRWLHAPDESYFGLGAQVTGLDLRGRRYPLWTQEQGIGKPEDGGFFPVNAPPEVAYAPMGVWHAASGWSALLDLESYSELDLRDGPAGGLRSWLELPAFVAVPGATPKERLEAITARVGRIDPPARWTFGPWNDAVGGPERLREVATLLRESGIPSTAIWSEDWAGKSPTVTGFRLKYEWDWDPEAYPDLPGDIAWLHARGFAFLGYFNPFVVETGPMFDEGLAGGFLVEAPEGGPYLQVDPGSRSTALVDLTNPDAVDWLKGYLTTAAKILEIDGWMADFAEWLPFDAVMHSGRPGWIEHNRYPLLWQQAHREAMEAVHGGGPATAEGWTFFARSGFASTRLASAGLAPTMWGGDQDTDWSRYDGLPSVVSLGVNLGLAGVAIFGSDIAGYSSFLTDPSDKELFLRWTAMAAFHPLMRTHHGSSECANWSFDRDEETLAHFRRWARVHMLLLPVFEALATEAVARGLPLTRHPWLVEPERPALWAPGADLFFLGDDVLVAPVVEEGATSRAVTLPGPAWWPLLGDGPVAGGTIGADGSVTVTAAAGPTEIPVLVRPGTALPLLAEPVDSVYGATEPGVTDLADVEGRYRLALYPALDGSVRETSVAGTTITGAGLAPPVAWGTATVDGAALPGCDEAGEGASCVLAGGGGVRVVGAGVTLAAGGATLTFAGGPPRTWLVAVGAAAWGELAAPTALTDLDPDIPPPCAE